MATMPGLRAARERALLTQAALAKAAKVSVVTIVRAEQGHPVQLSTIRAIAEALGVEPAALLGG